MNIVQRKGWVGYSGNSGAWIAPMVRTLFRRMAVNTLNLLVIDLRSTIQSKPVRYLSVFDCWQILKVLPLRNIVLPSGMEVVHENTAFRVWISYECYFKICLNELCLLSFLKFQSAWCNVIPSCRWPRFICLVWGPIWLFSAQYCSVPTPWKWPVQSW